MVACPSSFTEMLPFSGMLPSPWTRADVPLLVVPGAGARPGSGAHAAVARTRTARTPRIAATGPTLPKRCPRPARGLCALCNEMSTTAVTGENHGVNNPDRLLVSASTTSAVTDLVIPALLLRAPSARWSELVHVYVPGSP